MSAKPEWTVGQVEAIVQESIQYGYWITFRGVAAALGDFTRTDEIGRVMRSVVTFEPWMAALIYRLIHEDMYVIYPVSGMGNEFGDHYAYVDEYLNHSETLADEVSELRFIDAIDVLDVGGLPDALSLVELKALVEGSANIRRETSAGADDAMLAPLELERRYGESTTKYRKHQAKLRKSAFQHAREQSGTVACYMCGFDAEELLEAAHVIPDSLGGAASIKNIIVLCPTHHLAFDRGHFEIDPASWPDWEIKVSAEFGEFETVWIAHP